ncbi:WXG100 family type VII secretion target, partial [Bacillus toyonensis]
MFSKINQCIFCSLCIKGEMKMAGQIRMSPEELKS